MPKSSDVLEVADLVLLRCIIEGTEEYGSPPTSPQLMNPTENGEGFFNDALARDRITEDRASPMRTNWELQNRINKLRRAGMLEPAGEYEPTAKAYALLERVGRT